MDANYVSWREFWAQGYTASLVLVCLAVMLHAADSMVVATMLPSIVAEIDGAALVGLSVSLYEMGSIVAGAASAVLTMRLGLKRPMAGAALAFGAGCLISAASPSMPVFLAGRMLQGVGGGGLVAMSFIAMGVLFPRRYAARALAMVSTVWGASAFAGPLIGGVFVELATWRWGFAFFAGVSLGLGTWIALRDEAGAVQNDKTPSGFPTRRLALLCAAILMLAAGGAQSAVPSAATLIALGLGALALFIRLDGAAGDNRMLPRQPFDLRTPIGAALLMIGTLAMATIALSAFGPLLMTAIHGASALAVGYVITGTAVGWSLAAITVSGLPEHRDPKMIGTGMTLVALSVPAMLYAVPNGPLWLIGLIAFVEGVGFGMAWTFILRRTDALAAPDEAQRVAGAIPTVQRLGYALGAVYIGIVANAAGILTMEADGSAPKVAVWVFVASLPLAALGLIAAFRFVRAH